MNPEATQRREKINHYRSLYLKGELDYSQAEKLAQPFIDDLNKASEEIAKKYNRKFRKWTARDLLKGKGFSI